MTEIDIRLVKKADRQDLIRLYREAGWWDKADDADPSFLDVLVRQSALFAVACCGKRIIGMGRALSDGVCDAYIQDVAVLESHRGQGIGSRIIRLLINRLKAEGISWIGLVSEPGSEQFYARLGFEKLQGHTPYKLTNSI